MSILHARDKVGGPSVVTLCHRTIEGWVRSVPNAVQSRLEARVVPYPAFHANNHQIVSGRFSADRHRRVRREFHDGAAIQFEEIP